MRLIVNMSSVSDRPTGLGSYARRVCDHLVDTFDCRVLAPSYIEVPPGTPVQRTADSLAVGGSGGRLARLARLARRQAFYAHGPVLRGDLVYSPTHHGFLNARRQIITIHDLIALHHPENFPRQTMFFRRLLPQLLLRCDAVFTVSTFTRDDFLSRYDYPAKRVMVVPNALDGDYPARVDFTTRRDPYLLVVGAHLPHKNIEEVFAMAPLWAPRWRVRIVGAKDAYGQALRAQVTRNGLADRVDFLPFVSDEELDQLYRRATALLYPSTVEGFGLPPLEALGRGTLPIVSDIPVHRSVLGDAALFVRLGDPASWATAFDDISAFAASEALAAARADCLARYQPAYVDALLDAALLEVAPDLAAVRQTAAERIGRGI